MSGSLNDTHRRVIIRGADGTIADVTAGGELKIAGTFSASPPVGGATEAKQDVGNASLAVLEGTVAAGHLQVDVLSGGGGGMQYTEGDTDASITGTAVMWEDAANTLVAASAAKPLPTDPQDRALRDGGKVDVASLDQYTPYDADTGGGTDNVLPVALKFPASGGGVVASGDAAQGLDVDVTRLPQFITSCAYDGSDNLLYLGKAAPGTAASAASWQICKFSYSGVNLTAVQFADGSLTFGRKWDDRATLTYS
jgi:hypothetical protein